MTCIAYRNGVMAADTLVCVGSIKYCFAHKILKTRAGWLVGVAGDMTNLSTIFDWAQGGFKKAELELTDDVAAIIVDPEGNVWIIDVHRRRIPVHGPYFAEGGAGHIALGAMAMGAGAEQAVEIAMRHSTVTGGEVESICLR